MYVNELVNFSLARSHKAEEIQSDPSIVSIYYTQTRSIANSVTLQGSIVQNMRLLTEPANRFGRVRPHKGNGLPLPLPTTIILRIVLAGLKAGYLRATLYLMFLLAVVFIYLVLSAQFESFVHPFTILLSVPLAVFGALVTLTIFGQSLNIYSQIGLIMLIGLVTKNSILIVEFSNQLRARGQSVLEAVVQAATIRLRPILMTSFATIFGVLPIAIGLGAGAESRRPLGLAVVGGMFFSTFLTLVLVPVVYALLARFTKAVKQPGEERKEVSSKLQLAPVVELAAETRGVRK